MIIVIRFKYVLLYLVSLFLLFVLLFGRIVAVGKMPDGAVRVVLVSFLPLRAAALPAAFTVTSADPRQTFGLSYEQSRFFKVAVRIREARFPKGSPVTVKLTNLPTWLPGITRSLRRTVLPRIKPAVLQGPPVRSGTREPVAITFNTPLRRLGLERLIRTNYTAKLAPNRYWRRQRLYTDYAVWRIIPIKPLRHRVAYQINLQPGLTGIGGQQLGRAQSYSFTTVAPLKVVAQNPVGNSGGVPQYTPLRLTVDRRLRFGRVWLPGHTGETVIQGKTLTFVPTPLLLPDTVYRARVRVGDCFGETLTREWHFRTARSAALWVAVDLRAPQTITVYREQKVLKIIPISGPDPKATALRGDFRIAGRGYAFYCPQRQEGAYYWLRLANGWLIHSVVFGRDGQIKPGQAGRLGQPAGVGSIRMRLEDIKWLYRKLLQATPVLIHGPPVAGGSGGERENHFAPTVFFQYRTEFEQYLAAVSKGIR
jgi:hypothetical protein